MTDVPVARIPWYRPMLPRRPDEAHRASTPLECLFDLCFVVAVARAGVTIEESIGHGNVGARGSSATARSSLPSGGPG